jgi:hypothetical protein
VTQCSDSDTCSRCNIQNVHGRILRFRIIDVLLFRAKPKVLRPHDRKRTIHIEPTKETLVGMKSQSDGVDQFSMGCTVREPDMGFFIMLMHRPSPELIHKEDDCGHGSQACSAMTARKVMSLKKSTSQTRDIPQRSSDHRRATTDRQAGPDTNGCGCY